MKDKKPLTLKQAKRNLIKSGLFAGAAVIALIVATMAWFSSGDRAGADEIGAGVQSEGYFISNFYRWDDIDKDNNFDTVDGESWVAAGDDINTGLMVPNQKMFYKIEIETSMSNLTMEFQDVTVSEVPQGGTGTMTTLQEYLSQLTVDLKVRDKDDQMLGTDVRKTMDKLLLGDPIPDPIPETIPTPLTIINSLNIPTYEKTTIYYTLEMSSGLNQDMLDAGFSINIGNIAVAGS